MCPIDLGIMEAAVGVRRAFGNDFSKFSCVSEDSGIFSRALRTSWIAGSNSRHGNGPLLQNSPWFSYVIFNLQCCDDPGT